MSMLDTISEQVHSGVGVGIHGDICTITNDASDSITLSVERQTDADDDFDTGGVDLEFNKLVILVSPQTLGTSPQYGSVTLQQFLFVERFTFSELGRTAHVQTIVFADDSDRTWYVRKVLNDARASGYFKLLLTDTKAPLE